MRCKHCNSRLAVHDLWCANCGKQTQVVTEQLSALASLKRTWTEIKAHRGMNVPGAAFTIVAGIIPLIAFLIAMTLLGIFVLADIQSTGKLLLNLFIISFGVFIITPILLIPFDPVTESPSRVVSLKQLTASLRSYPRYAVLSLFGAAYYMAIYLICYGLPSFGSDPILRLVWIVLVNYFAAVILPIPVLMNRLKLNALKAFVVSYRHFHVARWQIYLLFLVLAILNTIATGLLLIPLVITLPLSWFAIRDYTDLLLEYELIRDSSAGKKNA